MELNYYVEYSKTSNMQKKIREDFKSSQEVLNRIQELQGTHPKCLETYIWKWQAGTPHREYEHFYEV